MFNRKNLTLTFLLGLLCSLGVKAQVVSGAQVIRVAFPYDCYFTALSDNGDWAVASGVADDETSSVYPYLVNARTGELIQLWPEGNPNGYAANDVTDDGNIVVGSNGGAAYYTVSTGEWTRLPVSSGSGVAYTVTPDGKRIAGFGSSGSFSDESYNEVPLLWERQADGTYAQIDVYSLPGFPRLDNNGSITGLVRITNMSADGNILAGAMNFIYPNYACYYVYNCTTNQTFYIDNYITDLGYGASSFVDESNISNDGTYITGIANVVSGQDEYSSAYRFNIKEQTLDLFDKYSEEQDRGGNAVSNAGTVFAASPAVNALRYDYVRVGNLWYGLDEIMSGRYGINIYNAIGVDYTGTIVDVSDDERVILGMAYAKQNGYIVRLPETFAEAASHINPFAAYQVSPVAGSQFARFRNATITFSKATTLVSGKQAQLLDSQGKVVRNYNISASADGVSFIIGGLASTLAAGETYTLYIPAGTFMLSADNSFTNDDIRIQYVGRENTPTQVVGISPDNGADVSELSTDNAVVVTFDMNVQVATDRDGNAAVGYLYEAGSDSPICELVIVASGNQIALAPALDRYLRKGVDYNVVIPAGSVTDIMGDCGNEEITVAYHGAYETQLSENADLFFDNFDDPSRSMATYLLYEGDHNNPGSVAASWEFDADNSPWNFTIRGDESSENYCVASHSMYSPAGQSDDWMSLPQLYIENDDYYLSFAAQSYMQTKSDVLEVIVLEEDGGYSSFPTSLYTAFNERGKTVFSQKLSPGSSQEGLDGDWTHYEVSLAEYAGKSVYIAFVNRNNNQSAIFVDSIRVYYNGDFIINNTTPSNVVNQASTPVTVALGVTGDDTYNSLSATCATTDGTFSTSYTATDLGLTSGSQVYEFTFPDELPLTAGEQTPYSISVTLDGTTFTQNATVKNLAFETTKRIVIEKATGEGCSNCPLGIIAFEYLERIFGNRFVPVEVHCNIAGTDQYAYEDYRSYLGLNAAPSGLVNRIDTVYSPQSRYYDDDYNTIYSFNSLAGNETWLDIMQREFSENPYADADLTLAKADYDTETRQITMEGRIDYAVNLSSVNQRLVLVIQENNLPGTQTNGFYTTSNTFFGDWGSGGAYAQPSVSWTYNHVARYVIDNAFSGLTGIVPVSVSVGEPVTFSLTRSAYEGVLDWSNAELVAMLVDATTGLVSNAAVVPFSVDGQTGINAVDVAGGINVSVADGQIIVTAGTYVDVTVYDASGSVVGSAGGNGRVAVDAGSGLRLVKVVADGSSVIKKVVVR